MSKSKRELTGEEKKLWRRVAEGVKTRKALPPEAESAEVAAQSKRTRTPEPEPQPVELRAAKPAPLQDRASEKRVRRGRVEIGATLDLHGHTWDTARDVLARFLRTAHRRGDRTVIVVTGVGRGGAGVLKRALPDWLAEPEVRALIAGYAQAHRTHGGAGAFYVFLKRAETDA